MDILSALVNGNDERKARWVLGCLTIDRLFPRAPTEWTTYRRTKGWSKKLEQKLEQKVEIEGQNQMSDQKFGTNSYMEVKDQDKTFQAVNNWFRARE